MDICGNPDRQQNRRVHAWLDETNTELWYKDTGSFVIGGIYEVDVNRGEHISRGTPKYTGEQKAELRSELFAKDHAARTKLARLAIEKRDIKHDTLSEILNPLTEFTKTLRTQDERDAFAAMVLRHINTAWR